MDSKKYSYLGVQGGLDSHYVEIARWVIGGAGAQWTAYRCKYFDCLDNEKFVAVRKTTGERVTSSDVSKLRDALYDAECGNRQLFKYQGLGL